MTEEQQSDRSAAREPKVDGPAVATMSMLLLAMFLLAAPTPAYAYVDPGTGSYLLQLLIGGFLGALYAIKLYWGRIRDYLTLWRGKRSE